MVIVPFDFDFDITKAKKSYLIKTNAPVRSFNKGKMYDVLISKVKGNIFTKESEILQYYEYQFVTYKLASRGFKAWEANELKKLVN